MKQIEINPANKPYYTGDFIKGFECGTKTQFDADKEATNNAIIIPRGATNGDVIKAMFPDCEDWKATIKAATGEARDTHFVQLPNNMTINKFDESWWNAPYKEAEE